MSTIKATLSLASAAAILAMSAVNAAPAPDGSTGAAVAAGDKVHCYGVNSCKGSADCKTATNDCKGANACKGHGFKTMKAEKCLTEGGVIGDIK